MKKKSQAPSDNFEVNFNKVLRFLSFRQRSEKEIKDYLLKKNVSSYVSSKIIEKLKEFKFLNDEEFARAWISSRKTSKPKPWRIIKLELRRKGISEELIESFEPEKEEENELDLDAARKIVEKKIGKYKGLSKNEIYQKLGRHLASKGFDWDTVKRSIDEVTSK